MKLSRLSAALLCGALAAACGDDGGNNDADAGTGPDAAPDAAPDPANFPVNKCADIEAAHCVQIQGGDVTALLDAVNRLEADTTLVLGKGTFAMSNGISIGEINGVHIVGQGIDETTLNFGPTTVQVEGITVRGGDDFLVQDLTVIDSPKDGIRVEDSDGVVYRRIRATWSTPSDRTNGAYGIYPVRSKNVLVENSRAEHASDAGLYVGQCQYAIIRNNVVTGNVAGLEIENTQYADVYGNTAEDNTGGIVVFDLPGNPIVGRDVRIRDNIIRNNNHMNFGTPGTTVAAIPAGTGTFAMASRRVEITGNTYANNDTGDIAILSGLAIDPEERWALNTSELVGDWQDLGLLPAGDGKISNFRSENILIAGNTHSGSGTKPDANDPLMLGQLFMAIYGGEPVDNVLYDSIGEEFDSTDPTKNTNGNHICVGGNTGGTFASMALDKQPLVPFFRPAAPFTPFECTALNGGPVADVTLP